MASTSCSAGCRQRHADRRRCRRPAVRRRRRRSHDLEPRRRHRPIEGGAGIDTVEVNGGGGAEVFAITANGRACRFDRLDPAPFAIDIGTSEKLVLNANGGDDRISTTGNLAALIQLTIDGGAGNDTILGGNGKDVLLGGRRQRLRRRHQADDVALLGAGDDASNGIRATAATWARARREPTPSFSTAAAPPRTSMPPPTAGACASPQPRQYRDGPRRGRDLASMRWAATTPSPSTTWPAPMWSSPSTWPA